MAISQDNFGFGHLGFIAWGALSKELPKVVGLCILEFGP